MLGAEPFIVINGDVWTDYPLTRWTQPPLTPGGLAHLMLVDNPPHHAGGDFTLRDDGQVAEQGASRWTFSGLSVLRPELFTGCQPGRFLLGPLLRQAMAVGQVSGEHYRGSWRDIGTPQRLAELDAALQAPGGPPEES